MIRIFASWVRILSSDADPGSGAFLTPGSGIGFCDICGYIERYSMTSKFFSSLSFVFLFLDPGSEIRDPGWLKIRIQDP